MEQQTQRQQAQSEQQREQPHSGSQGESSTGVCATNNELKENTAADLECGTPVGNVTKSVEQQKYRHCKGQRSAAKPRRRMSRLENTDVAIQERQKQQQRFQETLLIQREMGQLEQEHEEIEEVESVVEEALREAEGTSQEARFKQSWLRLVNERGKLFGKITELGLRLKELQLEHREYEVDIELNELSTIPDGQQTEHQKERFEELLQLKLSLVGERDKLVLQMEQKMKAKREQEDGLLIDQGFEPSDCDSNSPREEGSPDMMN